MKTFENYQNSKNDENEINLGECEDRLKEHYNITDELYF